MGKRKVYTRIKEYISSGLFMKDYAILIVATLFAISLFSIAAFVNNLKNIMETKNQKKRQINQN